MKRPTAWRLVALANIALLSLGAVVIACSDDNTTGDTLPTVDGGKTDTGGNTGTDSGPGVDSGPAGKPPGCFAGKPSTHSEFLNACTTSDYVLFDNCARIGFCAGGTLPPLRNPNPPVDAGVDSGTDAGTDSGVDAALPVDASIMDASDAG